MLDERQKLKRELKDYFVILFELSYQYEKDMGWLGFRIVQWSLRKSIAGLLAAIDNRHDRERRERRELRLHARGVNQ